MRSPNCRARKNVLLISFPVMDLLLKVILYVPFFLFLFMGLNEEGLPTFQDQNGNISVSDIYFQDREHTDFLQYSGSADPTDIGSLGNTFTYKTSV